MSDPRELFLTDVDLKKTRVVSSPNYVFLCGGPINGAPESARKRIETYVSVRHRELEKRLFLPERFDDWSFLDNGYPDLLDLETDLAYLVGAVVVVVESPGSIAELGSFSCIRGIAEKTIAVIRQDHFDSDSFIRWGPVESLRRRRPESVYVYDWTGGSDFDPHIPDLIDGIETFLNEAPKTESFAAADPKHVLLAIADVAELFLLVQKKELQVWLKDYYGVEGLGEKKLGQYIFLLKQLGLLTEVTYGSNVFYAAPRDAMPMLEYGSKTGTFKQKRPSLKAKVLEFYKAAQREQTRIRAWRSFRQELAEATP